MAWYCPRSFFCEFMDLDPVVSVHKHAKKELGQYASILSSHLVNNPYFSVYCLVFVSIEKTYRTLETVFQQLSKHLEFLEKCTSTRRIFSLFLDILMKYCLSCLIITWKLDRWVTQFKSCQRELVEHGKRPSDVLGRFYFYLFFGGVFIKQFSARACWLWDGELQLLSIMSDPTLARGIIVNWVESG